MRSPFLRSDSYPLYFPFISYSSSAPSSFLLPLDLFLTPALLLLLYFFPSLFPPLYNLLPLTQSLPFYPPLPFFYPASYFPYPFFTFSLRLFLLFYEILLVSESKFLLNFEKESKTGFAYLYPIYKSITITIKLQLINFSLPKHFVIHIFKSNLFKFLPLI